MKLIKKLIGSALLGGTARAALHVLAPYTGVALGISRLSLAIAAVLGVPGVTMMVLFQMF